MFSVLLRVGRLKDAESRAAVMHVYMSGPQAPDIIINFCCNKNVYLLFIFFYVGAIF